jgi:hypothetical protein
MVPLIAALALVSGAGSHAADALFVAGTSFVAIACAVLGIAVTAWMVETSSHDLERWRGVPEPVDPSWSSIESIDRDGARIDEEQAEHGSWGAIQGDDASAGSPGESD